MALRPTSSTLENTVRQRPDWFLPTVAKLEGRPEASFFPENY